MIITFLTGVLSRMLSTLVVLGVLVFHMGSPVPQALGVITVSPTEIRGPVATTSPTIIVKPAPVATTTPTVKIPPKPKPVVPVVPPKVTPPSVVVPTPPVPPPPPPATTTPNVPEGPTTIVIGYIPLLGGGTVHAGQTVPVSYLQITNVGTASTVVKGFWVTQTGTAPASIVIGLSTVDDQGGSRGSSGGMEGSSPFTGYLALAPADAHFEPGQLRLFTIKAKISSDVSSAIGQGITLVVSSVETSATVSGSFPIPARGTTWTIAQ